MCHSRKFTCHYVFYALPVAASLHASRHLPSCILALLKMAIHVCPRARYQVVASFVHFAHPPSCVRLPTLHIDQLCAFHCTCDGAPRRIFLFLVSSASCRRAVHAFANRTSGIKTPCSLGGPVPDFRDPCVACSKTAISLPAVRVVGAAFK